MKEGAQLEAFCRSRSLNYGIDRSVESFWRRRDPSTEGRAEEWTLMRLGYIYI